MRITTLLLILPSLYFCKPANLSNSCDPFSKSFFLGSIVRLVTSDVSPSCLPSFLPPDIDYWGVFGGSATVNSMEIYGNELILGGSFTALGPNVGSTYYLDTNTGKIISNFECPYLKANDLSRAVVSDGSGGYYIAGNFTYVRGTSMQNIVHMLPNCKIDENFKPNPNSSANIYSMVMYGDKLYIGGVMTTWQGSARNNFVVINRFNGSLDPFVIDASSAVEKLLLYENKLYIAGQFASINGFGRDRIARIDLDSSTLDSWVPATAQNSTVRALATATIAGTPALIVGGAFTTPRNYAFALDFNGNLLPWNPNPSGIVDAIAVSNNKIYLGGSFTSVNGGTARNNFAVIDTNVGNDLGFNYGVNGNVHQVIEKNGIVYLFGNFTLISGETRNYGASIDSITSALTGWNPNFLNPFQYPSAAAGFSIDGSRMLIPGGIGTVNYVSRSNIASVYLDTGYPTNWSPSINNEVSVLHIKNNQLFLGGNFTTISGQSRTKLAVYQLPSFELSSFNPIVTPGIVTNLISDDNNIYFGGTFTTVNGSTRNNVAAFSLNDFSLTNWNPNANSQVSALFNLNNNILLGGLFTTAGGGPRTYIQAVNKVDGLFVNIPTTSPDGDVSGIASYNGKIYIGGFFTTIGGFPNQYLASFQQDTGAFESNRFQLNGGTFYNMFVSSGGLMVIHGSFTSVNSTGTNGTAFIDLNKDQILAWNFSQTGVTNSQKQYGNYLFIGGNITDRGNQPFGGYHRIDLPKL
ncbi:hypothetical protein AB3N60_14165 [Leptospira sp. WS39.C2]